jgi:multidrug transporter EmrE-like cation transporter
MDRIKGWAGGVNPFAILERLLIAAALLLMAVTVGGQLGQMIGLQGRAALAVGWAIAIVYDALWIGSLRMSEVAIRQRSRIGMVVMLGVSAVAIGVSVGTLLILGHAKVFAGVPVAAAVLMGLRIFADNMLADSATATLIAEQSASARNARALAAADARQLASEACTDVVVETAEHLAEMERQIARAEVLTEAQKKLSKARAKAGTTLAKSDRKHGREAAAFLARELIAVGPRPVATEADHIPLEQGGHAVATQVIPEIEAMATPPAAHGAVDVEQALVEDAMTLEELALADGVAVPKPGVTLTDEQLEVVVRWLRYAMEPPRSYRQAYAAFKEAGFQAREDRVRRTWGAIETREAEAVPA